MFNFLRNKPQTYTFYWDLVLNKVVNDVVAANTKDRYSQLTLSMGGANKFSLPQLNKRFLCLGTNLPYKPYEIGGNIFLAKKILIPSELVAMKAGEALKYQPGLVAQRPLAYDAQFFKNTIKPGMLTISPKLCVDMLFYGASIKKVHRTIEHDLLGINRDVDITLAKECLKVALDSYFDKPRILDGGNWNI